MVDWVGNKKSLFSQLGATNHSDYQRAEHDYYATDPNAIDALFEQTDFFSGVKMVLEPACGGGHLAERMKKHGLYVVATDLYDYGYGDAVGMDFLEATIPGIVGADAIVTNPPYKYALEFCEKCVELMVPKFAMFLKLTFLESKKRRRFFEKHPPKYVAVFSERITVARNGDPEAFKKSSAACYAWFIWEKGFLGKPEILWLNKKGEKRKNEKSNL